MKTLFNILLLLLACTGSYAQCPDADKITYPQEDTTPGNYIFFNLTEFNSDYSCCDVSKISSYADFITGKAEEYIRRRGGAHFFDEVRPQWLRVYYPRHVATEDPEETVFNLKNYPVTYLLRYAYWLDGVGYDFSLRFNAARDVLSENVFPDHNRNSSFESLAGSCGMLAAVKALPAFKGRKVDEFHLVYNDAENAFCWLLRDAPPRYMQGTHEYIFNGYLINANTNRIVDVKQAKQTVILSDVTLKEVSRKKQ